MARHSVLVVDDERDTLDLFAAALSFVGFVVATATSGFAALRSVGRHDAIVVDLAMPGMAGIELIERIRGEELLPVPVIVVTGQADFGMLRQANSAACSVLTKPCDLRELADRLNGLIRACRHDCVACTARDSPDETGRSSADTAQHPR